MDAANHRRKSSNYKKERKKKFNFSYYNEMSSQTRRESLLALRYKENGTSLCRVSADDEYFITVFYCCNAKALKVTSRARCFTNE